MPNFAANLSMLFTEMPFEQRFAAAAKVGFKAVEYLFPYDYPPERLAALLAENGLKQVLFNLPAGDWAAGDRGIAADPARVGEFRAGVDRAIIYARALGVKQLNCLAGIEREDVHHADQWLTLKENLRFAAERLAENGLTLLIEFINRRDMPGFFLHTLEQALAMQEQVERPNLLIQYDVYHAQRAGGELAASLAQNLERIGHVQIADNPGRHQPGTGEINYGFLLGELDRLGYKGFVGLEYVPSPDTEASLAWLERHGFSL